MEPVRSVEWKSAAGKAFSEKLELVKHSGIPVVFIGPSGTGKTYWAAQLHNSVCPNGPLVRVYGAWSGFQGDALTPRSLPTKLAEAKGGTFFVDALEKLSPVAQLALAPLLKGDVPLPEDVHFIFTLQGPYGVTPMECFFVNALRYSLTERVLMPSLNELGEDVIALAEILLGELRLEGRRVTFAPDARAFLADHEWTNEFWELKDAVQTVAQLQVTGAEEDGVAHAELLEINADAIRRCLGRSRRWRSKPPPTALTPTPEARS
jgi:DNA-binding NtrC family response regulator